MNRYQHRKDKRMGCGVIVTMVVLGLLMLFLPRGSQPVPLDAVGQTHD
jgi:hypothetical protein